MEEGRLQDAHTRGTNLCRGARGDCDAIQSSRVKQCIQNTSVTSYAFMTRQISTQ
jgi:hypothetical protein